MAFDWSEPTPTIQEFVHSFVPTQWAPDSVEDLLYWDIKGALLVGPPAVRTAMLMRAGMSLEAAGYAATQHSIGLYRLFQKGARLKTFVKSPFFLPVTLGMLYGETVGSRDPSEHAYSLARVQRARAQASARERPDWAIMD